MIRGRLGPVAPRDRSSYAKPRHGVDRPTGRTGAFAVRELQDADRAWLRRLFFAEWGLPIVCTSGCHDPSELPGFVADAQRRPLGVVTYLLSADGCEVVTLNSLDEGRGVGSALLGAVKQVAEAHRARLWLITSDDNTNAIAFYRRRGMTVSAVHAGFIDVVRGHKPGVAADAFRDAIEFSY
jgi:GNAT superfamily N-acetyltransferase